MFAALLANWKTIAWGVVIATFLASIAAGVLEHKHLVADVTKTADAAGYARAVAEDKAALAAHLAHDAADKAAQVNWRRARRLLLLSGYSLAICGCATVPLPARIIVAPCQTPDSPPPELMTPPAPPGAACRVLMSLGQNCPDATPKPPN
jgi:hypothetical protein